jgi:CubicO group peptidase (beta-lactamase class C family)
MARTAWRRLLVRGVLGGLGLVAIVIVAVIATWVMRGGADGGLTAAARLFRHGPTTVYDFALYPARELQPGDRPAPFAAPPNVGAAPTSLESPAGKPASLAEILAATRTLAFLVIKNDAIVFEYFAAGRSADAISQYFSVTKSIFATLIGMAVDDGLIRSIDQPVTDFIPELASRGFARVTLRQLLDMTSALDYGENENPFGLHILMNYTSELETLILGFRLRDGESHGFRYKSGDTALLSLALQRALGSLSLTEYAQKRLWTPLGMEDRGVWSLDRAGGLEKAWCCLAGSARDLAKLGRLYLARGIGQTRPILSEEWIGQSAPQPPAAAGERRTYTLSWWPASARGSDYLAAGKDGQFLYIAPEHNAIVVRLGETHGYRGMSGWTALFAQLAAHDW